MYKLISGLLILFIFTLTGCVTENEPQGPSLKVGDSLPQFSVTLNTGEVVTKASLTGLVSVIVFFNTNCPDCQQELPVIQQLWDLYQENPEVKILLIAREESEQEILEYWKDNNLSLPFSPQESRVIYNLFAPSIIPRTYIADPEGIIKAIYDDNPLPTFSTLISDISAALSH